MAFNRKHHLDEQEVFNFVIDQLEDEDIELVSEISGVAPATLYAWRQRRIGSPRVINLQNVLSALGFELEWVSTAKIKPKKSSSKKDGGSYCGGSKRKPAW